MASDAKPFVVVTAIVLKAQPIGEYDRRVVLLTREMGKISAFAKGARRPNSPLVASTDMFCFGTFRMYAGRDSYTIVEASISNYFEFFRTHMEEALLATYFSEVCEYCTRENNDEAMLLLLMYQTLRALESGKFSFRLIQSIFEIKTVVLEGEFPGAPNPQKTLPAVYHAIGYIAQSSVAKLYSFTLEEHAEHELARFAKEYRDRCFDRHHFKSLEMEFIWNNTKTT